MRPLPISPHRHSVSRDPVVVGEADERTLFMQFLYSTEWRQAVLEWVREYADIIAEADADDDGDDNEGEEEEAKEEDEFVPLSQWLHGKASAWCEEMRHDALDCSRRFGPIFLVTDIWPACPPFQRRPYTLVLPDGIAVLEAFPRLGTVQNIPVLQAHGEHRLVGWSDRLFLHVVAPCDAGVTAVADRDGSAAGEADAAERSWRPEPFAIKRCRLNYHVMTQNFGPAPDLVDDLLGRRLDTLRARIGSVVQPLDPSLAPVSWRAKSEDLRGDVPGLWVWTPDPEMGEDGNANSPDEDDESLWQKAQAHNPQARPRDARSQEDEASTSNSADEEHSGNLLVDASVMKSVAEQVDRELRSVVVEVRGPEEMRALGEAARMVNRPILVKVSEVVPEST